MTAPTSADVLLWVLCAAIVVMAARRAWPFIRQLVHVVDLLTELPNRLEEIEGRFDDQDEKLDQIGERLDGQDDKLDEIQHEVTNNDGSSLKDSVDRTEAALAEHLEWAKTDTDAVAGRLARIEAQLLNGDIDQN